MYVIKDLDDLKKEYDKLQIKYGAKELDPIYNGGCEKNPDICFVFMNPTGKNIASNKTWKGRKSPWIGTKNIWKLFNRVGLLSDNTYNEILKKKPKEWDYNFADYVYKEIENNKIFITNLGKCTQIDAKPLSDKVLKKYLDLLYTEINIIKPKIIVTFGNQVSSIILNKKISVSENRKNCHELKIKDDTYKVYPVYYPVGNGIFNMDKSIEDIKWIIENNKSTKKNSLIDKHILLSNIDKIHTTKMGLDRIKKNLNLNNENVVEYCKRKILNDNCYIYKQGKNIYCEIDNIKITINSYSYTIITAHVKR